MNQQELQSLKALIVATAGYYSHAYSDQVVVMHAEDLSDLLFAEVSNAYLTYRRNPKNTRPPLPAQIRDIVCPSRDRDTDLIDQGRITAAKILEAIGRIGPYRPDEARAFMGDAAWDVVKRQGGWSLICETVTNREIGIHQAQWRDLAQSVDRSFRSEREDTKRVLTQDEFEDPFLIEG